MNAGELKYNFLENKQKFNLTWGGVFTTDASGEITKADNVEYFIMATKDARANLESQCAVRKDVG